ncbi:MAG: phosphoribosylformylglycinamidine cyclo-ligase, partial [Desulfatiglandales bacterium]
ENAELPGLYREEDFDLAGFIVGVVEREKIIDGSEISVGQHIVGISSSGLHSNGYSLARKVFFEELGWEVSTYVEEFGRTLGEELLEPTKIYVKPLLGITRSFRVYGIAHITGGGLLENIPRILPKGVKAAIKRGTWPIPPVFEVLKERGRISEPEMYRTFNNGLGMILITSEGDSQEIIHRLRGSGENAYLIGEIEPREEGEAQVVLKDA